MTKFLLLLIVVLIAYVLYLRTPQTLSRVWPSDDVSCRTGRPLVLHRASEQCMCAAPDPRAGVGVLQTKNAEATPPLRSYRR